MDSLYQALQQIGFSHPLHPPLSHMPTGLLVGAFIFLLIGWIGRRQAFLESARHCIVLALIFSIPTIISGVTDWRHFYAGTWSFPIKAKIVLSGLLLAFLVMAVILNVKKKGGIMSKMASCFLALMTVIGLGYYGGGLVFAQAKSSSGGGAEGAKLYADNCANCHPGGGNTINPKLPVIGSPQMKSFDGFLKFNRNPVRPDGSKSVMPAFPRERVSDEDMKKIYEYIQAGLAGRK